MFYEDLYPELKKEIYDRLDLCTKMRLTITNGEHYNKWYTTTFMLKDNFIRNMKWDMKEMGAYNYNDYEFMQLDYGLTIYRIDKVNLNIIENGFDKEVIIKRFGKPIIDLISKLFQRYYGTCLRCNKEYRFGIRSISNYGKFSCDKCHKDLNYTITEFYLDFLPDIETARKAYRNKEI